MKRKKVEVKKYRKFKRTLLRVLLNLYIYISNKICYNCWDKEVMFKCSEKGVDINE